MFLGFFVIVIFIGTSFYYHVSLNKVQSDYDEKVTKLEKIEEQLILQEEKLKELSKLRNSIKEDKENLENKYGVMKNEYEVLELEKVSLAQALDSRPFAKAICKATGNVQCFN